MTDAELFAYRKKTAPMEDLRFFLQADLSPSLRARAEATTPSKATMTGLYEAWRIERAQRDRARGIPAIGTPEWNKREARREARAIAERSRTARLQFTLKVPRHLMAAWNKRNVA
jgi:hypothetical protein